LHTHNTENKKYKLAHLQKVEKERGIPNILSIKLLEFYFLKNTSRTSAMALF
jgi:hypothetical protein